MFRRPPSDQNPSPEIKYPRVVTICRSSFDTTAAYWSDSVDYDGLLFVQRGVSTMASRLKTLPLLRLMFHPEVEKLLGQVLAGVPVGCDNTYRETRENLQRYSPDYDKVKFQGYGSLVTPNLDALAYLAAPHTSVGYIRLNNDLWRVPVDISVDSCWNLARSLGCKECPAKGLDCLLSNITGEVAVWRDVSYSELCRLEKLDGRFIPTDRNKIPLDEYLSIAKKRLAGAPKVLDALIQKHQPWKPLIDDFLFLRPSMTRMDPLYPAQHWREGSARPPASHHFLALEKVKEELSSRSQRAAKTQQTIREQCSKCALARSNKPVSACSEWRPRHCDHGAWLIPELVARTKEEFKAKNSRHCPFSWDALWRVANLVGSTFTVTNPATKRRVKCVIRGLYRSPQYSYKDDRGRLHILVGRYGQPARGESRIFETTAEFLRYLPEDLRADWYNVPKLKRENWSQFAMWLQIAGKESLPSYNCSVDTRHGCGFVMYTPKAGVTGLLSYGVYIDIWKSRDTERKELMTWTSIRKYFGDLPLFSTIDR